MDEKKKFMLSFIGSCMVLMLVVGVGYAFFTYSRMGYVTNTLSTGKIVFEFQDGTTMKMENQFPVSYADALAVAYRENGTDGDYPYGPVMRFTIMGSSTLDNGMNYRVYAVKGDSAGTFIKDSLIYLQIKPTLTTSGYTVTSYGNGDKYSPSGTGGSLEGINSDTPIMLLEGNIKTAVPTAKQVYEVRTWIDDRYVIISDTTNTDSNGYAVATDNVAQGKYGAKQEDVGKYVYSTDTYRTLQFSIKIKVEAEEGN